MKQMRKLVPLDVGQTHNYLLREINYVNITIWIYVYKRERERERERERVFAFECKLKIYPYLNGNHMEASQLPARREAPLSASETICTM